MVPPGLLIRTISAVTRSSFSALRNSSCTRARSGTRGGAVVMERAGGSSEKTPERSRSRIFAVPLPSTVSSSRGRIRGWRSMESTEQPASRSAASRPRSDGRRMRAVYGRARDATSARPARHHVTYRKTIGDTPRRKVMSTLTLEQVKEAARRLNGRVHRTPVLTSRSLDEATGYAVFLKCENLQRAGAFKIRGALNKLLSLGPADRARGVVAFSSGNHAQGVALAARLTGTTAVILMPTDAPALKLAATRGYGAEVVFYDRQTEDREGRA